VTIEVSAWATDSRFHGRRAEWGIHATSPSRAGACEVEWALAKSSAYLSILGPKIVNRSVNRAVTIVNRGRDNCESTRHNCESPAPDPRDWGSASAVDQVEGARPKSDGSRVTSEARGRRGVRPSRGGTWEVKGALAKSNGRLPSRMGACQVERDACQVNRLPQRPWAKSVNRAVTIVNRAVTTVNWP
jgi:hypothetical protein